MGNEGPSPLGSWAAESKQEGVSKPTGTEFMPPNQRPGPEQDAHCLGTRQGEAGGTWVDLCPHGWSNVTMPMVVLPLLPIPTTPVANLPDTLSLPPGAMEILSLTSESWENIFLPRLNPSVI